MRARGPVTVYVMLPLGIITGEKTRPWALEASDCGSCGVNSSTVLCYSTQCFLRSRSHTVLVCRCPSVWVLCLELLIRLSAQEAAMEGAILS